jgi:hypothetical protein
MVVKHSAKTRSQWATLIGFVVTFVTVGVCATANVSPLDIFGPAPAEPARASFEAGFMSVVDKLIPSAVIGVAAGGLAMLYFRLTDGPLPPQGRDTGP